MILSIWTSRSLFWNEEYLNLYKVVSDFMRNSNCGSQSCIQISTQGKTIGIFIKYCKSEFHSSLSDCKHFVFTQGDVNFWMSGPTFFYPQLKITENDYAISCTGYFSITHHNVDAILYCFLSRKLYKSQFNQQQEHYVHTHCSTHYWSASTSHASK